MPVTPSANILNLTADLYRFDATRSGAMDADGGLVSANCYPATPDLSGLPCAWHPAYHERVEMEQGGVRQQVNGTVLFAAEYGLKVNDKLVVGSQVLFVDGETDMASRGMCFGVPVRNYL